MEDIGARIEREVGSWDGVTVHPHRFGGVEFRLGRRQLGHVHREGWADLPFTARIREMLLETGRAEPHRFGVRGWVSADLDDETVELFRLSYERARVAQAARAARVAVSDTFAPSTTQAAPRKGV
jgi:hypothetical protein